MEFNKMKTATILLMIVAASLLITGCSKTIPATPDTTGKATVTDTATADLIVDTTSTSPDVGTLDNISVSDDLPQ